MRGVVAIQSDGDLEVVLLHETHGCLAGIIGPHLYSVGGTLPENSVLFHNSICFTLFLILTVEFFEQGTKSTLINQKFGNMSLLDGLSWFCKCHTDEANAAGLRETVSSLEAWVNEEVKLGFWCPDVDTEINLSLTNGQLINFGANATKHHLFRLSGLLQKLESWCGDAGYSFTPQQLSAVLKRMNEEVHDYFLRESKFLLELLGNSFFALNKLIRIRFSQNSTNRVNEMAIPDGVTSDVFRDLYGDVMVFKRYEDSRILDHTPVTTR